VFLWNWDGQYTTLNKGVCSTTEGSGALQELCECQLPESSELQLLLQQVATGLSTKESSAGMRKMLPFNLFIYL
jgi:hypothetical protein